MHTCNSKPLVSVIVPVYNAAHYLPRFFRSLEEQTYGIENLEILFVDDCSKDDSREVITAFCSRHPNARLLAADRNCGPGITRNRGIDAATGKYLSFPDADDYIGKNFYAALVAKAEESQADIVKTDFILISADGEKRSEINRAIQDGIAAGKKLWEVFRDEHQAFLFRRSFLDAHGLRYGEARKAEDTLLVFKVGWFAKTIAFVDDPEACYHYFTNTPGSIMNTFDAKFFRGMLGYVREFLAFLKSVDDGGGIFERMFLSNIKLLYRIAARNDIDSFEGITEAWYLGEVRSIVDSFEEGPRIVRRHRSSWRFYRGKAQFAKRVYRLQQPLKKFGKWMKALFKRKV